MGTPINNTGTLVLDSSGMLITPLVAVFGIEFTGSTDGARDLNVNWALGIFTGVKTTTQVALYNKRGLWPGEHRCSRAGGRGTIDDGALEQSNVNISTDFFNLIVAQGAFEENSKTVTTFDKLSQDVLAMV